jgi:tRNA (cytidine32/guanosine34-2'-O)-methyltransferase
LVICDGAPDVTGVHDLDAYLHYQLLLAAITLTLTILRKGGTAVYKVFLSPMDPKGEMLKSQVAPLFGGLMGDLEVDMGGEGGASDVDRVYGRVEDERRQHGVWMCKPRSSRAGSGGEPCSCLCT